MREYGVVMRKGVEMVECGDGGEEGIIGDR